VLAAPAYAAGALLWNVRPELARLLEGITYSSSITAVLGYEADAVRGVDLSGFGFLVPRSQGKRLLACTFVHHKFPHRAPPNRALHRCFIGGENADAALPQLLRDAAAVYDGDIVLAADLDRIAVPPR